MNSIIIRGGRENNLRNIDLTLPRDRLIVLTGVSGSGKTSLAFDTIFAEGQRRYVESLSSYARQFLGQMDKPSVDSIDGLSPSISIDQKTTSRNPRSTVGTVTEIYDYLRLAFARLGVVHCPRCGQPIAQQSVDVIVDRIMALEPGSRIMVMAPLVRGRKGEHTKLLEGLRRGGFARVKVDGAVFDLTEDIFLDKNTKHNISVIVDRLVIKPEIHRRLTDSIETALKSGDGIVIVDCDGTELLFNTKYTCPDCDLSIEEVEPRLFSFNSPWGACPACTGLGVTMEIDPALVVGDPSRSINDGALGVSGWNDGGISGMYFRGLAAHYGFGLDTPFGQLPDHIQHILLYGTDGQVIPVRYESANFSGSMTRAYEGIVPNLSRRYRETSSDYIKADIERYMTTRPCPACNGQRLKPEALSVRLCGHNIWDYCTLSISDLLERMSSLRLEDSQRPIFEPIFKEISARLQFLTNVGLDYLTLARGAATLSGGEAQRIRLATQIGSGLQGVLYILDEPSIGLHQRDNDKLLHTLCTLRDLGNTVIVVEHDEDTIRAADHIVDIGPYAGEHGGEVVASGTLADIIAEPRSVTGRYLSGECGIAVPSVRRTPTGPPILLRGARQNNLRNIDVEFPLGVITAVTGVSGSGKSSLVNQILFPALSNMVSGTRHRVGEYDSISGAESIDKVINIDQSPIGRTPRSNPATYCGLFTPIRELFAATPDARERGYNSGRFSFNVKGGRCAECDGDGIIRIEMHFLPDVFVPCKVCGGKRYNRETLSVRYKGQTIADVLNMTVDTALEFFGPINAIANKLSCLADVGLGYIRLGQPSTTLSGGEAQRVKLATELSRRATGRTLYLLDEPTTGLSTFDVDKLLQVLARLASTGNTIIVIEHNLDVIKVADHVIDLGPQGGARGGTVIGTGTPEQLAQLQESFTGQYLRHRLGL